MNWLNILLTVVGFYSLLVFLVWFNKDNETEYFGCIGNFFGPPLGIIGLLLFFLSFIFFPILPTYPKYGGYSTYCSGELISLENSKSLSGEFSGGGSFLASNYSGKMGGATFCSFVINWNNNNMAIITEDAKNISFHVAEGENYTAQKECREFWYPYRLKGEKNKYWALNDYVWHIWIPKDSIQKYVKFN